MRQEHLTISRLAVILALAVVGLSASCGDGPTGPKPAKDYAVYFNSGTSMRDSYRFYPRSGVVDTFSISYDSERAMAVSASGSRLYLENSSGVVVVSSDSMTYVTSLPYKANSGGIAVSPDGRFMAVAGDDLHVLRTFDYSVVFSDTGQLFHAVFSCDSKTLYCIGGYESVSPQPCIYTLEVSDTICIPSQRNAQWPGSPWRIVPSLTGDRWFLLLRSGLFDFRFAVYDVAHDSLVFQEYHTPGSGDIAQSKDGKFVFYSNPGTIAVGPAPPSSFTVFNVEDNRVEKVVNTGDLQSATPGYFPIGSLAVTPDGRYLIGLAGPGGGEFVLFNIGEMEVVDNRIITSSFLGEVVCQNGK